MIQKYFGLCLKLSRRRLLLTQSDVSNYLNISRQAYCNYELGRSLPTPDTILDLSYILKVDLTIPFILFNQYGTKQYPIKEKSISEEDLKLLTEKFIELSSAFPSISSYKSKGGII